MAVRPIPEGFHNVTPSLVVNCCETYRLREKGSFGGQEVRRMPPPGGKMMHAEVKIGHSIVMLSDAVAQSPNIRALFLYVNDVETTYRRAVRAVATPRSKPTNMFWGDRVAEVRDQCGKHWSLAVHKGDVSPHEI
jgi:uncharacterized glyoxalase superfamily protein PhnB